MNRCPETLSGARTDQCDVLPCVRRKAVGSSVLCRRRWLHCRARLSGPDPSADLCSSSGFSAAPDAELHSFTHTHSLQPEPSRHYPRALHTHALTHTHAHARTHTSAGAFEGLWEISRHHQHVDLWRNGGGRSSNPAEERLPSAASTAHRPLLEVPMEQGLDVMIIRIIMIIMIITIIIKMMAVVVVRMECQLSCAPCAAAPQTG